MEFILDLHAHTIASGHAYSTIQEEITAAKQVGLKMFGISDHAPGMPGSQSIIYFQNLKVVPDIIEGVRVLKGVEANILDCNGTIDMNEDCLKKLDYAIASLHPPCIRFGTKQDNTRAVIQAMKNPYVNIMGHLDDSRYPLQYENIVKAAKDFNVLIEINNSSLNPKGFRMHAKENIIKLLDLCVMYDQPIILSSDAHISYDVGNFENCKLVLNQCQFPQELIVNTSIDKTMKYLNVGNNQEE